MRILGVDPGSRVTGWGILDSSGWEISLVAHGAIRGGDGDDLGPRLLRLAEGLRVVIVTHAPDVVVVEQIFSAKNARSALVLGHARGVALLIAADARLPVHEYAPTQVKSAVTGSGRAEKRQVQAALATQLAMRELPTPLDASDALAIALCHAAIARMVQRLPSIDVARSQALAPARSRRPARFRLP